MSSRLEEDNNDLEADSEAVEDADMDMPNEQYLVRK